MYEQKQQRNHCSPNRRLFCHSNTNREETIIRTQSDNNNNNDDLVSRIMSVGGGRQQQRQRQRVFTQPPPQQRQRCIEYYSMIVFVIVVYLVTVVMKLDTASAFVVIPKKMTILSLSSSSSSVARRSTSSSRRPRSSLPSSSSTSQLYISSSEVAETETTDTDTTTSTTDTTSIISVEQQEYETEFYGERPPPTSIEQCLRWYQYSQRIIKLVFNESDGKFIGEERSKNCYLVNPEEGDEDDNDGGILAEVQDDGTSKICRIIGLKTKENDKDDNDKKKKKKKKKINADDNDINNRMRPPRLIIQFVNGNGHDNDNNDNTNTKVIDVGQITTVWKITKSLEEKLNKTKQQQNNQNLIREKVERNLPIDHVETILERKYKYHVSRGRNVIGTKQQGALTKKQIDMISAASSIGSSSLDDDSFEQTEELRIIIDKILKQCLRCGSKYTRLLDSYLLEEEMFYDKVEGTTINDYSGNLKNGKNGKGYGCKPTSLYERLTLCATVLAEDTISNGRFKRMPCMWLPPSSTSTDDSINTEEDNESLSPSKTTPNTNTNTNTIDVTIINGGWIVVDESVRAAVQGRQFAKNALANGGRFDRGSNDERILCRLESLACGERLKQQEKWNKNKLDGGIGGLKLEVDVRTTLEVMSLPFTSEGAQEALIRMGRWTNTTGDEIDNNTEANNNYDSNYERWSSSVLEASKWYNKMDILRRQKMKLKILEIRKKDQQRKNKKENNNNDTSTKKKSSSLLIERRIDLTALPCICVDAAATRFRDDAFGIRTRSSTGRKVHKDARFEILVHIADVSDIYAPDPYVIGTPYAGNNPAAGTAEDQEEDDEEEGQSKKTKQQQQPPKIYIEQQRKYLQELEQAACSRIRSKYDLPLGPLHLLPTTVLQSLSLDAYKHDWTSDPDTWPNSWQTITEDVGSVNRCVTVWVYIDETNGRLLDMGMERSIISRPLALTFEHATKILDMPEEQQKNLPPLLAKARALLTAVETNIRIWEDARIKNDDSHRAREEKLRAKEFVSKQVYSNRQYDNNNNRGGGRGKNKKRDDGRDGSFNRSRGHNLVDSTLVLYENAFRMMRSKKHVMIPIHYTGQVQDAVRKNKNKRPSKRISLLCHYLYIHRSITFSPTV
jgi:cytoskeletal protein RodZ